ncbi:MAG: RNA methyltransferase [Lachnospiraceae bacterium]|nr:RNA methyltransferase [Lachnospiraceae bacterium]
MAENPGIKKIREVRALCERPSVRRRTGLFVVEGERIFDEIPQDDIEAVYMSAGYLREHPESRCDYVMKDGDFVKLADTKHPQGVLAVVRQRKYEIRDIAGGELYIILDTIQDPGNLGTIIRTAEAAGAAAVIMNKGCADIYSPKVVRSTMGSIFRIPFIYAEDLSEPIREIKKAEVTVYAADVSGVSISEEKPEKRRAFIIGNEGNGISEEVLKLADRIVSIPMAGKVESLNAAVSAAILMFNFIQGGKG